MNLSHSRLMAALLAAVVGGCVVGPAYHPPVENLPAHWSEMTPATSPSTRAVSRTWWQEFKDPELNSLLQRAARNNLGIKQAEARIREARAKYRFASAALWPSADASASYTRLLQDEDIFGPLSAGPFPVVLGQQPENLFEAGFDAQWEIDLFGHARRTVEAAQADVAGSYYRRAEATLTIIAEVARNYIELRGFQQQLAIARRNLAVQKDILALTRARYTGGLVSELDVQRAQALVESTAASIPALEVSYQNAAHRLSVLLGEFPGALDSELRYPQPIPVAPFNLPPDLPSSLLRQRPDIRRAERKVAAATARIGVATSDLYPRFSLIGFAGLESLAASEFFDSGSRFWGIGPSITWPIFRGRQLVAVIKVRQAQQQQAVIAYRQTILKAVEEVENALAAYTHERDRRMVLANAVTAKRRAASLARALYLSGLTDFLSVLDAQRDLLQSQRDLARSDTALSCAVVALHKALGGGWRDPSQ